MIASWVLALVALAGCGRIGFDAVASDGPDSATWSLVQSAGGKTGLPALTPTGSGNLVVVAVQLKDSDAVVSITDDAPGGSNTYVAIPAAHAIDSNAASGVEIWYATNSRPGATGVFVVAGVAVEGIVVWEVSWSPTVMVDAVNRLDSQAKTVTPSGASVTTTAVGDFVVSVAILEKTALGIHAGNEFTNDVLTNANGWAHITSAASAAGIHQAQWDQDVEGTYCSGTVAFRTGP